MCESCGCTLCDTCGTPVEHGICADCGELLEEEFGYDAEEDFDDEDEDLYDEDDLDDEEEDDEDFDDENG